MLVNGGARMWEWVRIEVVEREGEMIKIEWEMVEERRDRVVEYER